ncbi:MULTISPECIES: hypothetical protein [unclassified Nocardioides]|uniref:hypothetical protein n=1 Tax=unclassified Nocardioides TaxID=2615069 RepID=UPI00005716CC|nr:MULTISPECIES: hypothetical protein [unclassified Nocardioides]ABL80636.1 hypothetical protein Noca_1120 [Nocardioides sp. JS614]
MEIVTGEPAPTVERDEAARLLREMAAVVRTLLGAPAPVAAVTRTDPPAPAPSPAPSPVPAAPVAPAPPPLAGLPVPSLPVPSPASLSADPEERRSLAALQEIAFLDE